MERIRDECGERYTYLINEMLRCNTYSDEFDRKHQYILKATMRKDKVQANVSQKKRRQNKANDSEDLYIIFVMVQEWSLMSAKGCEFFATVEINSFEFYDHLRIPLNNEAAQMVFIFPH